MTEKGRGELFEVLGRNQESSRHRTEPISRRPLGTPSGEPWEIRLGLVQIVILGTIVLCGVILAYLVGTRHAQSADGSHAVATLGQRTAQPVRKTRGEWTLRLLSLPEHEPGQKVKEFLTRVHGIPTGEIQVRSAGANWVVEVFRITDRHSDTALAILNRFREMEYNTRQQFRSSYYARAVD